MIGSSIHDLDTPALLLDADVLERNLRRMADFFKGKKAQLRPHFKNHKCTTLARRQLAAGSCVGLTCAKLGEAEVLAEHGFDDILIANQVVGPPKVRRLTELARRKRVQVAVDAPEQAEAISQAAAQAKATVGILIEVDTGMARCGIAPGEPALELARRIIQLPGLRLEGIQAFEGHVVYINDFEQRSQLARQAMTLAIQTRRLIEQHGIPIGVISGSSTSTHAITGVMEGVDEVQAGTYPTMDWRYHEVTPQFEIAMTVLARVISRRDDVAVLDLGVKGAGAEFGLPHIKGHPEVEIPFFKAEEHCAIQKVPSWRVGQTVELIPSHACTTCNLHRQFFVHQDSKVVDIWPIEAAGKLR